MIRQMTADDVSAISKLVYLSFWPKIKPLHHMEEEDVLLLTEKAMFCDEETFKFHYVFEVDGQIAGYIKLKTKGDKEDFVFNDMNLIKKMKIIPMLKAAVLMVLLDSKAKEGCLYIESIAVSPDFRGQGIGSKLIKHAEVIAESREDISCLTLHVIEENTGAKRLYERVGFVTKRSRRNSIVKWLSGVDKVYYMVKTI